MGARHILSQIILRARYLKSADDKSNPSSSVTVDVTETLLKLAVESLISNCKSSIDMCTLSPDASKALPLESCKIPTPVRNYFVFFFETYPLFCSQFLVGLQNFSLLSHSQNCCCRKKKNSKRFMVVRLK